MGKHFIVIASIYLLSRLGLGYVMGISDLFQYTTVHAHVNLVGWVTSALFGIVYLLTKKEYIRLITAHFWIHNTGFPLLILGMIFIINGNEALGGHIRWIGCSLFIIGDILFSNH